MSKDLQRIRVAIADDHPIILLAVKDCLESTLGYEVAIQETSGRGLLGALGSQPVSLIVTDFSMQHDDHHDGLRLITQLRRQYEHIPIVVFTMVTNPGVLTQLCRVGVAGLIGKDEEMAELGRVCQRVMAGACVHVCRQASKNGLLNPAQRKMRSPTFRCFRKRSSKLCGCFAVVCR